MLYKFTIDIDSDIDIEIDTVVIYSQNPNLLLRQQPQHWSHIQVYKR